MSSTSDEEERNEARLYRRGIVAAVLLTVVPFAVVWSGALPREASLAIIGVCALLQIVVQFRFFLHIDLGRQQREDLQLILFSALVLILVAGGTVWVLADLGARMMPAAMEHDMH
jgi:cytochrome o ubiquinol oxidase operon protein cyoD